MVAAIAERRQVYRVLTTDRRDFSAIRVGPRLARALELVPLHPESSGISRLSEGAYDLPGGHRPQAAILDCHVTRSPQPVCPAAPRRLRAGSREGLTRISHRLNPRLRGGAASPEAGRAEDYSGYENRGEDRKMRSEMPMDGLCLLEDDGVNTRCLSALRSSSSGGRIGQVAELG